MVSQLEKLSAEIEDLRNQVQTTEAFSNHQFSTKAAQLAGDAAHLMIFEVLDWRVIFLDRPLNPPA